MIGVSYMVKILNENKLTLKNYDEIIRRTVTPISQGRKNRLKQSADKIVAKSPKVRTGNIFK